MNPIKRIAWFREVGKEDIALVGGKGANLGEMTQQGFPVPPGFFVTAPCYKEFIERTGIKETILTRLREITDYQNNDLLQQKANTIQELIINTQIPSDIAEEIVAAYHMMEHGDVMKDSEPWVAVRSSATAEDLPQASFAGQQATFLNVKGAHNVLEAVRKCWASLFTARAIYYRMKNGFDHEKVYLCAVVQKMVNSEISGIMFTANPSTNDPSEIVVEAVYGLGETIVSGAQNPDTYIVNKEDLSIKEVKVRTQEWGLFRDEKTGGTVRRVIPPDKKSARILDDVTVASIASIGKKLEEHYQKAQDIEWAIEEDTIYIVQTRAITTLTKKAKKSIINIDQDPILKGEVASPGVGSGKVVIVKTPQDLTRVERGDVMVATMTTPDMVPAMQRASAIVTDEGGMTCHAAIVSREMGIPCVVGTEKATTTLKEGEIVTVYASAGKIYRGKVDIPEEDEDFAHSDIKTKTGVKVICDLPQVAQKAAKTGADGIGLCRLELIIANSGKLPSQYIREGKAEEYTQMLVESLRDIARAFDKKPVWVRTSDLRTDEYRHLEGGDKEPKETDPMIGWHGIRRSLDEPEVLKAEFRAIKLLHDEGYTNVGVMIPFVIRAEEVSAAKKIMQEVGLNPQTITWGVMCETPAACWVMDKICEQGIKFVSFGTNDLTQLTLGIDRNNSRIAKLFDEMHPAVLGEIAAVIKICQKYGVETSICGQAGSRPEMAEFLVKKGITSISANPDAVAKIREVVFKIENKLNDAQ
ncbi:phosphoenolpyruvate synthase [Candidatus Woesearchaeota archaeon]|nr:MAG: phosphoenolpyruvate synthase [Candidatus Woesearchaeota archaeon]